jgi:hypothetical protein
MASKMYEEELMNMWTVDEEYCNFDLVDYIEEEKKMFLAMDFCLY